MDKLTLGSLTAFAIAVLITLACGGGAATAPAARAPAPIEPAETPTPLAIAPSVRPTPSAALLVIEDFFEAFNQGNVGALKGIYSDTIILLVGSRFPDSELENTTGLADVLEHDRESIEDHVQITPSSVQAEGDRVTSQISYTDEELERDGLAPLSGSMSFKVEQGKIAAIVVRYDDESKQRFAKSIMGKRVPDFQMRLSDESIVSLDDLLADDRPVFLYFFAVWCGVCRAELGRLKEIYPDYSESVALYAVGTDPTESLGSLEEYRKEEGHPWPVAEPVGTMLADFRILRQSTKIAFDSRGGITFREGYGAGEEGTWRRVFEDLADGS